MQHFDWDARKNTLLKIEREVSFEEVVMAISEDKLLDILEHPNKEKYPKQRIFVINNIDNYAYLVPFVEDKKIIFLKTVIPSRKATKKYIVNK